MLKIVVVDLSAESRNKIVSQLSSFLSADVQNSEFLPRVSINPLSIQELKYHEAPDLCVIGDGIVRQELLQVGAIRNIFPDSAILVRTTQDLEGLAIIEQLARMGVTDTFNESLTAPEFVKKVVLHARKVGKKRSGQLIVVGSGKGGTGVTSITAGLAETAVEHGKRVAVIDFDFATQDLSRFLRARPYLNENLRLLCEGQRPITQEFVEQCLVRVWSDGELFCMPPVVESDNLYNLEAKYARALISIIEILDATFDLILVDCAGVRGALWRTLLRLADTALVVVSGDPASMYANVDHVAQIRANIAVNAKMLLLENSTARNGLSSGALRSEFNRAARLDLENWVETALPYNKEGGRWPASGATLFSLGQESTRRALRQALSQVGVIEPIAPTERHNWYQRIYKRGKSSEAVAIHGPNLRTRAISNSTGAPDGKLISHAQIGYDSMLDGVGQAAPSNSVGNQQENISQDGLISSATIL